MRPVVLLLLAALAAAAEPAPTWAVAIHGGAGAFDPARLPAGPRARVEAGMNKALAAAGAILAAGGGALDAVQAAVTVMEDDGIFNAGRGAVATSDGRHELDASIMDGNGQRAGAVAGVQRIRNPLALARLVMERSSNVLLVTDGAELFARQQGVELLDPRWIDAPVAPAPAAPPDKHGTVGAVARDAAGHLAAATSTGGMSRKRPGRVGDSPLIGAGTWAQDGVCAISATGHGEYFIRHAAAHAISARIALLGEAPEAAARKIVVGELAPAGGEGGVIVLGASGPPAAVCNTTGMFHGWLLPGAAAVLRLRVEAVPAQETPSP